MSANYGHLLPAALDALDLPVNLRVRDILERRFITHERINAIFKYVDYLMLRPSRSRAAGMVIIGDPGAGKTDLLEQLRDRFPCHHAQRALVATKPALLFSMCGVREARTLYVRMLSALDYPDNGHQTYRAREQQLLSIARMCGLKLLLIDEIQDVLMGTRTQQVTTLETLRFLMNELGVVLVVAGSEEAEHAIGMDAHLSSRLKLRRLPKWRADNYFAHFLQAMESSLPLRLPSRLHAEGTMKLIVALTDGQTDAIVTLIANAAALAVLSGEEHISHGQLELARTEFPDLRAITDDGGDHE